MLYFTYSYLHNKKVKRIQKEAKLILSVSFNNEEYIFVWKQTNTILTLFDYAITKWILYNKSYDIVIIIFLM